MTVLYSDLNSINPTEYALQTEAKAIYESLYNILLSLQGERLFNQLGANLDEELFSLNDDEAELRLYSLVVDQIEDNEPRVILDFENTKVEALEDDNMFKITLAFEIQGLEGKTFQLIKDITV